MKAHGEDQSESIYLDCVVVMPGDILLTAQNSAVSKAIAAGTGGPFSHAALILGQTVLLEADGHGTGHTTMFYERVEQLENPRRGRFLYRLPATTQHAKVLRYPGLADNDPDLFRKLSDISRPFLWKEYPELCKLAEVFHKAPAKQTAIRPILRVLDKYVKKKVANPGMFCSELVAAIFEILGCSLSPDTAASEMSPNAIAKCDVLGEVNDALTTPDESAAIDEPRREALNTIMRMQMSREVLPGLVEFQALVDKLKRRAETGEE